MKRSPVANTRGRLAFGPGRAGGVANGLQRGKNVVIASSPAVVKSPAANTRRNVKAVAAATVQPVAARQAPAPGAVPTTAAARNAEPAKNTLPELQRRAEGIVKQMTVLQNELDALSTEINTRSGIYTTTSTPAVSSTQTTPVTRTDKVLSTTTPAVRTNRVVRTPTTATETPKPLIQTPTPMPCDVETPTPMPVETTPTPTESTPTPRPNVEITTPKTNTCTPPAEKTPCVAVPLPCIAPASNASGCIYIPLGKSIVFGATENGTFDPAHPEDRSVSIELVPPSTDRIWASYQAEHRGTLFLRTSVYRLGKWNAIQTIPINDYVKQ